MKQRAFTLIELLVVIAIIAILLSVLVPSLRTVKESAKRVTCGSNMRGLGIAVLMYADEEKDRLPPMANDPGHGQARTANHYSRFWYIANGAVPEVNSQNGIFWNLGVLWQTGKLENGELFFCTSRLVSEIYRYPYYAVPQFPTAKATGSGSNTAVRVSYSYNPECVGNTTVADREMKYTRKSKLQSTAVLLADNINSAGPPHAEGWNIAKGDGSVSYFKNHELSDMIEELNRTGVSFDGGSDPIAWKAWDRIILEMKPN